MKIYVSQDCPVNWQQEGIWTDIEVYKFWKAGNDFKDIYEYIVENPKDCIKVVHTSNVSVLNYFDDEEAIESFYSLQI